MVRKIVIMLFALLYTVTPGRADVEVNLKPGEKAIVRAADIATPPATQPTLPPEAEPTEPQPDEPPADPDVPAPVFTTVKQSANVFAIEVPGGQSLVRSNTMVTQGGLLKANQGAKSITLINCASLGTPHGGGVYVVLLATKRVDNFLWDNSGIPDAWVTGSTGNEKGKAPGECGFRVMGGAGTAVIRSVNFRCGTWVQSDGKRTYWKGATAIRDVSNCLFENCTIIGPQDVGEQENAGQPQTVANLTYRNTGMTELPRISRPKTGGTLSNGKKRSGVKRVEFVRCPKIDSAGRQLKDSAGKPVLWPDTVWTPDSN